MAEVEPPAWTPRLSEPEPVPVEEPPLREPVFDVLPLVLPAMFRPALAFDAVPEALRLRELAVAFDRLPVRPSDPLPLEAVLLWLRLPLLLLLPERAPLRPRLPDVLLELLRPLRDEVPELLPKVDPVRLSLPALDERFELLRPLREPVVELDPEPVRLSADEPDVLWLRLRLLRVVESVELPDVEPVRPRLPWLFEVRCALLLPPDSRPLS